MPDLKITLVISEGDTDASDIWEILHHSFLKMGYDRTSLVHVNQDEFYLSDFDKDVIEKQLASFELQIGKLEIRYVNSNSRDYGRPAALYVSGYGDAVVTLLNHCIGKFIALPDFLNAWLIDSDFDRWQNIEEIRLYESYGRNPDLLPKAQRNLPPPFDEMIIDITGNPGRRVFRNGYIEAIGCPMWLGNLFWEKTGRDREGVLSQLEGQATVLENGVVRIDVADHPFTEDDDPALPANLRKILFGAP